MPEMLHITPSEMLLLSLRLGKKLYETGFRPKHAVSIWRGGTVVGLGVDEFFRSRGVYINHTTIATESYVGIGKQEEVVVKGLEHVVQSVCREDGLLIIDDVYETGRTIRKIVEVMRKLARANAPERVMVGAIHRKPDKVVYRDVEVCTLADVPGGTWIDYPHELADLITDDPGDPLIKEKSEAVWEVVRQERFAPKEEVAEGEYRLLGAEELTLDALRLGVNIFADKEYHPNFIVALWPGGVAAGLPLHEAYKYKLKKSGEKRPIPDHISLNTLPSRLTYKHNVIGLDYLAERINRDDNVLIVDSTFKDGRLVNDAIARLKEVLRRNLNDGRVRVASVYWNPDDGATWTTPPIVRRPHYWVKKVVGKVIYPHAFHRLRDPRGELAVLNPAVGEVLFGE